MYIPKKFEQKNALELTQLIEDFPFAVMMINTTSGLDAQHLPFIFDQASEGKVLQGHLAKTNPCAEMLSRSPEVLIVFNGPNCYVSPNHYPTKAITGKVVPTWNYITVHVKGTARVVDDHEWKLNHLNALTDHQEARYAKPWSMSDAPENYINRMLPAVVGIEVKITAMKGQWKVSQNQSQINQQGVIDGLSKETEVHAIEMSEWVKRFMQ